MVNEVYSIVHGIGEPTCNWGHHPPMRDETKEFEDIHMG